MPKTLRRGIRKREPGQSTLDFESKISSPIRKKKKMAFEAITDLKGMIFTLW